jgi:hypothetical protein
MSTSNTPQPRIPPQSSFDSAPHSTLHGVPLLVARVVWLGLAALTLSLFALSIAPGYKMLRTVCTTALCGPEQLGPAGVQTIQALGLSLDDYAWYSVAVAAIFFMFYYLLAALLFWRRSHDRMALFVAFTLLLVALFLPGWITVLEVIDLRLRLLLDTLSSLMIVCFFLLFYLFPDGRFVPRWTRWIALVWIALQVPVLLDSAQLAASEAEPLSLLEAVVATFLLLGLTGTGLYAQLYRYRYISDPAQRQQTKWVVFGLSVTMIMLALVALPGYVVPALDRPATLYDLIVNFVSFWVSLLVPLSFSVAILRYRLFDIDVIIRRTLIYGILTTLLAIIYAGGIVVIQMLLSPVVPEGSPFAIVTSTLATVALAHPLRERTQEVIDRRFYRRKYDAQQTLAQFAGRLREEVELDTLCDDLETVVQYTLQPAHVSVWLCEVKREV